MDDVVNRFARELADSIAAAVSESAEVEACRERARAAGYEMKVNLEAVVGFVNRGQPQTDADGVKTVPATKAIRSARTSAPVREEPRPGNQDWRFRNRNQKPSGRRISDS